MYKKNNNLRDRYEAYPDEKLVEIISINRNSYTEEAVNLVTKILEERGCPFNYEEFIVNNKAESELEAIEFELADGIKISSEAKGQNISGVSDRIQMLFQEVKKDEVELTEKLEEKYISASDEELLSYYANMLKIIYEKKNFGGTTENYSVKNYILISDMIKDRNIEIPSELEMLDDLYDYAESLKNKTLTKKALFSGITRLTIGLLLIFMGLFYLAVLLEGRMGISIPSLFVMSILFGFGFKNAKLGFTNLRKLKLLKEESNKSPSA